MLWEVIGVHSRLQNVQMIKWALPCLDGMHHSIACDRLVPENRQTEGSKDRKQRRPEDLALKCNRPTKEAHKLLSLLTCVNVKEHRIVLYMFILFDGRNGQPAIESTNQHLSIWTSSGLSGLAGLAQRDSCRS